MTVTMFTDGVSIYLNVQKLNEKWILDYNLSDSEPELNITIGGKWKQQEGDQKTSGEVRL